MSGDGLDAGHWINADMLAVVLAHFTFAPREISECSPARGEIPRKTEFDALHVAVAAVGAFDFGRSVYRSAGGVADDLIVNPCVVVGRIEIEPSVRQCKLGADFK
jgi:hypothetical protein